MIPERLAKIELKFEYYGYGYPEEYARELLTEVKRLAVSNERMLKGLREIEAHGEACHCDVGYSGGCGCGRRMVDMASDARCTNSNEYGSCSVCDECNRDLT